MEKKFQAFLDKAFAPYGEFPARADVAQELFANLKEKFGDLKQQGMNDDQAYQATIDSFGDVQNVSFDRANLTGAKLKTSALQGTTFAGAILAGTDFSRSDLTDVSFDEQTLEDVKFNSVSLTETSFRNATLRNVSFHDTDVGHAMFDGAQMEKVTYAMLKSAKANLNDIVTL